MNVNQATPKKDPRWLQTRKIAQRIVITGTLSLLTPARFGGGGKVDPLTDMPILRDPEVGKPLLPGASISGAMRAYLREWETGYEQKTPARVKHLYQELFGHVVESKGVQDNEKESLESYLIIEDARAEALSTEFRPGVKINPKTRTAKVEEKGGQLFDMELLEAGTQFTIHIELALPEDEGTQTRLKQALAVTLTGFERGEIGLGARKRRGFGECQVTGWQVETFDLKTPQGLIAWLEGSSDEKPTGKTVADLLGVSLPPDIRRRFNLIARFRLETSLLIRSGGRNPDDPDMTQLTSKRAGKEKPILSGTSLAGAIRGRALRIANTLILDETKAQKLVAGLFGPDEIKEKGKRKKGEEPWASRAVVRESTVKGRNDLVQTRIKIDRFTGGTYPGALFEQQPVFGGPNNEVCIEIELRNPKPAHIGLLLHVLKDLWTGDLPLGGEASVGRGRLKGVEAMLEFHSPDPEEHGWWKITSAGVDEATQAEKLNIEGPRKRLEAYAQAVQKEAHHEPKN